MPDLTSEHNVRSRIIFRAQQGYPDYRFACLPGVSAHPAAGWAVQAAREFTWTLAGQVRYLIRGRAGQFTGASGAFFAAGGTGVLRPAPQCPRMNAYAGRAVPTIRTGCADRMLIMGQWHLKRVLAEYIEHRSTGRAHRALNLRAPGVIRSPRTGSGAHECPEA